MSKKAEREDKKCEHLFSKKRPRNDTIAHHFGNYYGSDDYVMYGII